MEGCGRYYWLSFRTKYTIVVMDERRGSCKIAEKICEAVSRS